MSENTRPEWSTQLEEAHQALLRMVEEMRADQQRTYKNLRTLCNLLRCHFQY